MPRANKLLESLEVASTGCFAAKEATTPTFTLPTLTVIQKQLEKLDINTLKKLLSSYGSYSTPPGMERFKIRRGSIEYRHEYRTIQCYVDLEYTNKEAKEDLATTVRLNFDLVARKLIGAEFVGSVREL